jgi:hypothetical protein
MGSRRIAKNAVRCKPCGDVIESKRAGDFVRCSCRACAVDGGMDYLRRVGAEEDMEELSAFED